MAKVKLVSNHGVRKFVVRPHRIPTKAKPFSAAKAKETGRQYAHGAYEVDGTYYTDVPGPKVIEFVGGAAEVEAITWATANQNGEATAAGIEEA